jgi:hypothetical protein
LFERFFAKLTLDVIENDGFFPQPTEGESSSNIDLYKYSLSMLIPFHESIGSKFVSQVDLNIRAFTVPMDGRVK